MKMLLDILIALLIIVIIAGGALVGYLVYDRQNSESTATNVNTEIIPADEAAPPADVADEPAATPLVACSAAQRERIVAILAESSERIFSEFAWLNDPSVLQTVQDFSTTVPDVHSVTTMYFNEYYPQFPTCAEGFVIRDMMGYTYDSAKEFITTAVLSTYVFQFGDEAISSALVAVSQRRDDFDDSLPSEVDFIERLRAGSIYPDGVPECGEAAGGELAKYAPLLDRYQQLYPQYLSFMETRSGDFYTLLEFEDISMDAAGTQTELCYENFQTEVQILRLFTDTTLAIHIAQLAAFEERRGDFRTAENLQVIVDFHRDRVAENVGQLLPELQ